VSCFRHGSGEVAVSFINWNAIPGNDGNAFLSRSRDLVAVCFPGVPLFFAHAAYDWKCETYMHQAWSMLATWEVV